MTAHVSTVEAADAWRSARWAMGAGLGLTVAATVYPLVDRMTTGTLAAHVGTSYPGYAPAEVDTAVTAYLTILSVAGVLGAVGWLSALRAARAGAAWVRWVAPVLLVAAVSLALAGLTVQDTSGDVGLAPAVAWWQVPPCVAGVVAVVLLWRRR